MITYTLGSFHLGFIWRITGSTIPMALLFSVPSAAMAALLFHLRHYYPDMMIEQIGIGGHFKETQLWQALNVILGLVLSFRTSTALNRYWTGNSLLHQMRVEWYSATSCLVAFTQQSTKPKKEIEQFHHLLVRLMSLLFGLALHQIQDNVDNKYCILGIDELDAESLMYLQECTEKELNKVQVVMHWIQNLVTHNSATGMLPVPAPILTRVYQDLSKGMLIQADARNITEVPFPFPYAQIIVVLLISHMCLTPVAVCVLAESSAWAFVITFVTVTPLWAMNFVAGEIEQPFGNDHNDLPLEKLQEEMNASLLMLLDNRANNLPKLAPDAIVASTQMSRLKSQSQFGNSKSKTLNTMIQTLAGRSQIRMSCITLHDAVQDVLAGQDKFDSSSPRSGENSPLRRSSTRESLTSGRLSSVIEDSGFARSSRVGRNLTDSSLNSGVNARSLCSVDLPDPNLPSQRMIGRSNLRLGDTGRCEPDHAIGWDATHVPPIPPDHLSPGRSILKPSLISGFAQSAGLSREQALSGLSRDLAEVPERGPEATC